jgi:hypothetical protein
MTRRSLARLCTGAVALALLLVAPAYGQETAAPEVIYPVDNFGPGTTWLCADFFGLMVPALLLALCGIMWWRATNAQDAETARFSAKMILVVHGVFLLRLLPYEMERFCGHVGWATVTGCEPTRERVRARENMPGFWVYKNRLTVRGGSAGDDFETVDYVQAERSVDKKGVVTYPSAVHVGSRLTVYYVPGLGREFAAIGDRATLSFPVATIMLALMVGMADFFALFALFATAGDEVEAKRPRRHHKAGHFYLGSHGYVSPGRMTDALEPRLGLQASGSTFLTTRFDGVVGPDARRACVDFTADAMTKGTRSGSGYWVRFEVGGKNLPDARIVRGAHAPKVLPRTPHAARDAFERGGARARALVQEILEDFETPWLQLEPDKLVAAVPIERLEPDQYRDLLDRLAELAGRLERRAVTLHHLKIEALALPGTSAVGRCSYCHADVTGHEPELVSCARCRTVLHEACWKDCVDHVGHCPLLGCDSTSVERGPT